MEPQLPTPDSLPEINQNKRSEQLPAPHPEVGPAPQVEQQPGSGAERGPEQKTQSSGGGDPKWQAPALPPLALPTQVGTVQEPTVIQPHDTPLVAKDDDLIEQEWVQRAKKIVASTKNDPYLQEKEVSKLQADYLQKRYGKELKLSSD